MKKTKKQNVREATTKQRHSLTLRSPSQRASDGTPKKMAFPVVGIGASAGGLEAFTQLLSHLPIDTDMAFVLIQHLDPKHESMSSEILSRATRMQVTEVKQGTRLEPNHIYVIPPNFRMGILNGVLSLLPRTEVRGQHLVIDFFFQSLAEDQKQRAIGVVLSGTAADGTEGLAAIKAEGGITFAQDPQSAKFDSMPQNAIASGAVDLILPPKKIAEELGRLARHPYVFPLPSQEQQTAPTEYPTTPPQYHLNEIILLIRNLCHVDFTHYKHTTIRRRIERRMMLHKMDSLNAYGKFLSENPEEIKALYADILIHVTGFFRDPEAFQTLKETVFPKLMEHHTPGTPIRIWVPGCSTGEEAYSIAICLTEYLGEKISQTPIQIFATDISEQAIQKARLGEYSDAMSRAISTERLNRFFTRMEGGGYKIAKFIRDMCLFSRHDVISDPPFAKIHLISCRNLLIYFTATLQKHVIPIFHYALLPEGTLWLGQAESIAGFSDLFSIFNQAHKIYVKKSAPFSLNLNFPASTYVPGKQERAREALPFSKVAVDTKAVAEEILQTKYPGVLINEDMEILQFLGNTSPYIQHAPGVPSYHILKVTRPEILRDLRMAIQMAKKQRTSIEKYGLSFKEGRKLRVFHLKVIPSQTSSAAKGNYYLVLFEEGKASDQTVRKKVTDPRPKKGVLDKHKDLQVEEVEKELIASQEYQQALIEKYENAQADLTTANEELQSANEELQSTNEELETAKEELQSGNEELTTVNDELQVRSAEQIQTNDDLVNLLGSVQIPIVMLGNDRKIRRFTPLAGKALNLISTDVGRPIGDLKFNFTAPGMHLNLDELVSEVIGTMSSTEFEVQDLKGRWYRLQTRPYKTLDGRIDGAVLALVDINDLKQSLQEVKIARSEAEKANRAKDLFLATLSHELRTPLTAILSWAQLLSLGKLDAEKIKQAGRIIEDCGRAQAELINDLLDVSRIIVGKLLVEMSEVNPADIVTKAIESVRSAADKNSIQIETVVDPNPGTVLADRARLQQVFSNLLTNAIKFSSPHSTVLVSLDKTEGTDGKKARIFIKVKDSGKGIHPQFLPSIFDPFSQQDSSSIRIHGGLGLGLAIVRNLVELHGGEVLAESPGQDLGATFTVVLPIKSKSSALSIPAEPAQSLVDLRHQKESIRLEGFRVLLVDDQLSSRVTFTELLQSLGAQTQTAESAQEALELFERFRPHVLISDIAMPKEDGYSLIRKIRALPARQGGNTPALALTAYASQEDMQQTISAGFQVHLAKPVDRHTLAQAIAQLAGKKRN